MKKPKEPIFDNGRMWRIYAIELEEYVKHLEDQIECIRAKRKEKLNIFSRVSIED